MTRVDMQFFLAQYGLSPLRVAYVKRAFQAGIDAIGAGASLPLDVLDLAAEHPKTVLLPRLSASRGVQLAFRK